jgi:glycine oxidase
VIPRKKATDVLIVGGGVMGCASAWSNFRPYTADELPLLGPTRVQGLLLATGHYRNGILLAPITAAIVTALVQGKKPPVDLAPFSADRA